MQEECAITQEEHEREWKERNEEYEREWKERNDEHEWEQERNEKIIAFCIKVMNLSANNTKLQQN